MELNSNLLEAQSQDELLFSVPGLSFPVLRERANTRVSRNFDQEDFAPRVRCSTYSYRTKDMPIEQKFCVKCRSFQFTVEKTIPSCDSWMICGGLWIIGCWFGGCLLPFLDGEYFRSKRYCVNCSSLIKRPD